MPGPVNYSIDSLKCLIFFSKKLFGFYMEGVKILGNCFQSVNLTECVASSLFVILYMSLREIVKGLSDTLHCNATDLHRLALTSGTLVRLLGVDS